MRFGSVCSGIEAASVAWEPLGWQAAWFSEIEPFPCAVLKHHYPAVPNHGDMTTLPARIRAGEVEAPDLFCGGTPCQAFSVAGQRRSLDDARGNLSITFCEVADAIDAVRLARGDDPAIIVWENVPGVLTTKDNAFGCFLGQLAGENEAIEVDRWPRAGLVDGRRRRVAWVTLDAQFFGLAQRRRRVFVLAVAHDTVRRFGEGADPAAILSIGSCLRGDTPSRSEAGQGSAAATASRTGSGGGAGLSFDVLNHATSDVAHTLSSRSDQQIGAVLAPAIVGSLDTECGGNKLTHQTIRNGHLVGTLTARMFNALGARDVEEGAIMPCMRPKAVWVRCNLCEDFWCDIHSEHVADCECPPLEEWMTDPYGQVADWPAPAVGFDLQDQAMTGDLSRCLLGKAMHHTLRASSAGPRVSDAVLTELQVRRLTPRECERLQGFPDDYTAIPYKNKPADECPDGPRYKALGNSWAVPVVRWIGARIAEEVPK